MKRSSFVQTIWSLIILNAKENDLFVSFEIFQFRNVLQSFHGALIIVVFFLDGTEQSDRISDYEKGQRDLNHLFKCTNASYADAYYKELWFVKYFFLSLDFDQSLLESTRNIRPVINDIATAKTETNYWVWQFGLWSKTERSDFRNGISKPRFIKTSIGFFSYFWLKNLLKIFTSS